MVKKKEFYLSWGIIRYVVPLILILTSSYTLFYFMPTIILKIITVRLFFLITFLPWILNITSERGKKVTIKRKKEHQDLIQMIHKRYVTFVTSFSILFASVAIGMGSLLNFVKMCYPNLEGIVFGILLVFLQMMILFISRWYVGMVMREGQLNKYLAKTRS